MNIKDQLKDITKDILSEESLNEIQKSFDEAVNDKIKLHVEKALVEQDEDYANKLQHLLEVIDKDHTKKLQKVVEAIDTNHSLKLKAIVKKYKNELIDNAKGFKNSMINNVSTYLEAYLDESIPTETIKEAVSNKRARVVLEQLKDFLAVDSALSKKAIRDAVVDGKRQIDEAQSELEAVKKELTVLKEQVSSKDSQLVLEKVVSNLPEDKAKYLRKIMNGKSSDFIKENTDYALRLFDKTEKERLLNIAEEARTTSKSIETDTPSSVLEESVEANNGNESNPLMNVYFSELRKY